MIFKLRPILYVAALALTATPPSFAQKLDAPPEVSSEEAAAAQKFKQFVDSLDWKTEGEGPLGSMATLKVPAGYRFTGGAGTIKLMEVYGNLTNGSELGYIAPLDMGWFAVFEFQDCGYVKDDEKNKLDADKSGTLTMAEYTSISKGPEREAAFTARDTDKDGSLTLLEFCTPPPKK